ncbi:hypothetical protein [Methylobacterium sp. ID0610]|uniref:hypothetical protein n=1 Tax=Methylobacterium carpenticola TaxID=3344827 RepID=UPI0036CD2B93
MGLFERDAAHPAGPYSSERMFEWSAAVMMVLIALTLAMPGDTLERGALKPIQTLGVTEEGLAVFFGICGALRGGALYLNGHINNGRVNPSGAIIRAWCALFSALVWGEMALTLFIDALKANAPALGIPIFGTLTMFELLSCFIARKDAVRRQDTLEGQIEALRAEAVKAGISLVPRSSAGKGERVDG